MNQSQLFDNIEASGVSLDDAANQLNVSVASIRNWIKTGYLEQIGKSVISLNTFEDFKKTVAGGAKLTARANKSLKDSHNHKELLQEYYSLISNHEIKGYDLALRYEEALSDSYRNKEGIYYTPPNVVACFFHYLPKDCSNLSFCDPCCGSGNFIIAAIEYGIPPENIYGYDIDPFAVEVTKKRIFELTGYKTDNIQYRDFLESSLQNNKIHFDIIFTNPPWGKKIKKSQKELYARSTGADKSTDTSSLFFFECLSRLTDDGYLGFLLQDAFFNISSYEDARKKALEFQIISIIDFGRPFKGLLTKAKGIIINNTKPIKEHIIQCSDISIFHSRLQSSFLKNPKFILNSSASKEESDTVSHLYKLPHTTLYNQARWGLGIVTGNNKKFIQNTPRKNYVPAYKGLDIKECGISEPTSYIPDNLSLYQQVAPMSLYQAREKLIYKFISSKLVFFCDNKQRYLLNSANMLIPYEDFPLNQRQLKQILNSKVINWLFRTVFDTHKVLRSDLEILPIHFEYFKNNTTFNEHQFNQYLKVEELDDGSFRIKK